MSPVRRLLIAISGLGLLTAVGTVGYVAVADMAWLDALFMTVITLSTVGYEEVVNLDGAGKAFTIGLIVSGVGTAIYLFTAIGEVLVEGRLRQILRGSIMERRIDKLVDHVILCGYGRFGRVVADDLARHDVPIVIVDQDPAKTLELERSGMSYLIGSALLDEVLDAAGIARARAIVIATGSDADNVFIALSARESNPGIRIHARGESEAAARRLRLAGATQVISAYQMGGQRVAAGILRPAVVDFLEIARPRRGEAVDLEEVRVGEASALVGLSVAGLESRTPRVRVVALKRGEEPIQLVPAADTEVLGGDHLVVIGPTDGLAELARCAC